MHIIRYRKELKSEWDQFVANAKNATFLFMRDYMDYHSDRFTDASLMFYKGNELRALLPLNHNIADCTADSHGGLTYGGFILSNDSRMGEVTEMMRLTTEWAKEQLHAKKIIYKPTPYIYHLQPSQEDLYALFAIGARLTGRSLSSTIDNKERIAFGQLRRRKAQKAAKEGITYKEDNDYVTYWEILTGLLAESHNCTPTHTVEEIELLHSRFPDKIKLYTAYKAEKMLAGCVVYETKKTAHIQYIASSPEGKEKGALDGLFKYLFENIYNKIEYIDFGISTERRGAYLNEGLLFQKEGFGGRAVTYDIYEISLTD
jgi:hypothetical protein